LNRFLPAAAGTAPDWTAAIAFRWRRHSGRSQGGYLQPVKHIAPIALSDLHNIAPQKEQIDQNTAVRDGKRANNVLLPARAAPQVAQSNRRNMLNRLQIAALAAPEWRRSEMRSPQSSPAVPARPARIDSICAKAKARRAAKIGLIESLTVQPYSRTVIGVDADIIVRQIAGPDGRRGVPRPSFTRTVIFTLLHDALAIGFPIIGIASAIFGDPDIIQIQIQFRHIQIIHAGITDCRQNASQIRIGGEEGRFHQRRMANRNKRSGGTPPRWRRLPP